MNTKLTNLLPKERRSALTRDYFLRLSVVCAIMASILLIISAILLVPTYVFLSKNESMKEKNLASVELTLSSKNEAGFSSRLAMLAGNVSLLNDLASAKSVSKTVSSMLEISRSGIILSDFSYAPDVGTNPGTITISGTAVSRDALRSYQLELSNSPFISSVELPVSAYAKDSDIRFTITVTLTK